MFFSHTRSVVSSIPPEQHESLSNLIMKSSLLPLPRLLAAILLIALSASSVLAQKEYTYSPSGPVTFRTKFGVVKTQVVSITNTTHSPTFLKIKFFGDTSFKFNYSQTEYLWVGADSTANFTVTYLASWKDTSIGYLRMYDSINTADTIKFIGMDTIYVEPPPPLSWKIDSNSRFYAGSFYGLPDTAVIRVRNLTAHSIDVGSSTIYGGFEPVGAQERTIVANGTTDFKYCFNPAYDSIVGRIRIYGESIADTVDLFAQALRVPTYDSLSWSHYTYYTQVLPGDSMCQYVTIYNRFDSDAVITALTFADSNRYYFHDAPSFPLLVAANDSVNLNICFRAPDSAGVGIYSGMWVTYQFNTSNSRTRYLELRGSTRTCIWTNPKSLGLGLVHRDSTKTRSFYLVNNTDSSILIDSLRLRSDSDPGFELTPNTSITIPPHDSVIVGVTFTADGDTNHNGYVRIFTQERCHTIPDYYLNARVYPPLIEGIELFADSANTLFFSGDSSFATQIFRFINDLSDSINVLSVALKQGIHFEIDDIDPHYPELLLGPTDWMDVTLQFIGNPGTYDDTLVIVTESAFVSLTFPIHAVISGSSVGASIASSPVLLISPNPATGPVRITLDHAPNASIEVLDVMGKLVTHVDDGMWDRANVSSGSYFVRATGIGEDGKPFVITTRIVLK
jgi:hypothetical protein